MTMKDYRTIVVGTDGSDLAAPTVARAAWLATRDHADLVIICAFAELSRRDEAKNVATLGDTRSGQVLGRAAADLALARAGEVARAQGATVSAALLIDGEPAQALVKAAEDRSADLIVMGAVHDRSLAGRLLGTTAEEVTKKATCDVLIVRPVDPVDELEVPEDVSPS
ncbi:MAG: universal stress protein [Tetrasphaera sp.]|nr:universal stress protein [Tetrasphaera sp.]